MKKISFAVCIAFVFCAVVLCAQLVSEDKCVKDMMPSGKAVEQKLKLTAEQIVLINKVFNEELIKKWEETAEYHVYTAPEGNAFVISKQGKWGIIEMMVLVDAKTGKVINLEVLSSSEKRVRPIAMNRFLRLFCGKGINDKIIIGNGINGISRATISSESVAHIVKKAVAINKIIFLQ